MGLHRTHRKRADRLEEKETKATNRIFKNKEQKRRNARMIGELKAHDLPYSPNVMSWLSRELEKPSRRITTADVKSVLNSYSEELAAK